MLPRQFHYRPQRSCEGYVFTGVCLSTGGGCLVGGSGLGGVCSWEDAGSGGVCSRGVFSQGRLVSQHALRQTPPRGTATAADSTHPTGMHSCCVFFQKNWNDPSGGEILDLPL